MSALTIRPVRTKRDEKSFIKFQWDPYKGNPYWVPPLLMDRRKLIDRKKNPFYKHARMELFLAERDGKVVGRIGAIVNDNHNREHNENIGFFGFFECWTIRRWPTRCSTPPAVAARTGRDRDARTGEPVGERRIRTPDRRVRPDTRGPDDVQPAVLASARRGVRLQEGEGPLRVVPAQRQGVHRRSSCACPNRAKKRQGLGSARST